MLMHAVETYLAVRRAGSYSLADVERHLRQFAAFADARGETHVRRDTAIAWAAEAPTAYMRCRRLAPVIGFARYLHAEDPRHEIPPAVFPRVGGRRLPYIYTDREARRLIAAASRLGPVGSLRPLALSTLLALLFATGLRISEALGLRFGDVTAEGLVIRETKFRKTRLVPLHPTAVAGLARYLKLRRALAGAVDHVFVNTHGAPLSYRAVHFAWIKLLAAAGLPTGPTKRARPHLHDIRHTFVTRALEDAPAGRDLITRHALAVSTYVGHSNVSHTYWYYQSTPALMSAVADQCQRQFEGARP